MTDMHQAEFGGERIHGAAYQQTVANDAMSMR